MDPWSDFVICTHPYAPQRGMPVRLVGQVISVAIVTMVLSLDWNWLPQLEGLVRNIEISFIVFTLLCLIGILPSVARRARGTER